MHLATCSTPPEPELRCKLTAFGAARFTPRPTVCCVSPSWAESGPGRFKASTPSIQVQILTPAPKTDLVAYGRCVQRDREIFWSDVEVAGVSDGRVVARGTVLYRILT